MEHQVPQFIEMESKIIGPLTLKQFVYIAGGIGLLFLLLRYLPFFIAVLLGIPTVGFASALAFYKINNKPFEHTVEAAIKYYTSSRFFLWKKYTSVKSQPTAVHEKKTPVRVVRLTRSKLRELAGSLDVARIPENTQM